MADNRTDWTRVGRFVLDSDGNVIARCRGNLELQAAEENAARIVECVNSHEVPKALVGALRMATLYVDIVAAEDSELGRRARAVVQQARVALREAGEPS